MPKYVPKRVRCLNGEVADSARTIDTIIMVTIGKRPTTSNIHIQGIYEEQQLYTSVSSSTEATAAVAADVFSIWHQLSTASH